MAEVGSPACPNQLLQIYLAPEPWIYYIALAWHSSGLEFNPLYQEEKEEEEKDDEEDEEERVSKLFSSLGLPEWL